MINLDQYQYNDTIKPEQQEITIKLADKIWATKKNYSIISGKPKSRKSTIANGIVLSHQTGKEVFNMSVNTEGKVCVIDTEQTTFDYYHSLQRLKLQTDIKHLDHSKFNAYLFRMLETEQIIDNIEQILLCDQEIKILILDSITDLVNDMNCISEAKALISRFKKWTNRGITIVGLIHIGKTSQFNSIGHIGSFLERSCQSMASVEKNPDDPSRSQVKSQYMRSDIDFYPFDVVFYPDSYDIQEPITKLSNKNIEPELMDLNTHLKHLKDISMLHPGGLSRNDIIKCLQSHYGKGEKYVKGSLLTYLKNENYLTQNTKRQYFININGRL